LPDKDLDTGAARREAPALAGSAPKQARQDFYTPRRQAIARLHLPSQLPRLPSRIRSTIGWHLGDGFFLIIELQDRSRGDPV